VFLVYRPQEIICRKHGRVQENILLLISFSMAPVLPPLQEQISRLIINKTKFLHTSPIHSPHNRPMPGLTALQLTGKIFNKYCLT
jgi:hypothetical protein